VTGVHERLLNITSLGDDRFEADAVHDGRGDAYGGDILARSLLAMASTVPRGRLPHSIHSYYLRPAQNGEMTTFSVVRERDGRTFSTRRATAAQRGKDMFIADAGFHDAPPLDAMASFQRLVRPEVPSPESLPPGPSGHLLLDLRIAVRGGDNGMTQVWATSPDPLSDDPAEHLCLLAYFADFSNGLFGTPLGGNDVISLDHVMWFHRPVDMSDWVLMDLEPVVVASGRGTYRGMLYDRAGNLVASFVQEMFGMARNHNV
jgi:acyl-CoA thioesterase II